jgi:hypothetical protein
VLLLQAKLRGKEKKAARVGQLFFQRAGYVERTKVFA